MRECPFPGDGEFSWQRFADVYNNDLANKLGNLRSRSVTLMAKNYENVLTGTAGTEPERVVVDPHKTVKEVQSDIEACRYNQALERIMFEVVYPANQYTDRHEPWKLVKTDKAATAKVLFAMVETLRVASILLKPFLPRGAEAIYRSFNFATPWEQVRFEHVAQPAQQAEDLRVLAELEGGKVKPLFPRIG
jgi:methionyl-tRNA synthetase